MMKKKQVILISLLFGISVLATSAFAGDAERDIMNPNLSESGMEEKAMSSTPMEEMQSEVAKQNPLQAKAPAPLADTLIGKKITSDSGSNLGEVVDVYTDKDTNEIAYLTIKSGGILGLGSQKHAIPFHAISIGAEGELSLNMEPETLKNAPESPQDLADREWGKQIHEFYGISPYWEDEPEESESMRMFEEKAEDAY